jgi:hypothetical protein
VAQVAWLTKQLRLDPVLEREVRTRRRRRKWKGGGDGGGGEEE